MSERSDALAALGAARAHLHEVQRATVLGTADESGEALDAAVVAYRRARARAARWLDGADGAGRDRLAGIQSLERAAAMRPGRSPEELLARWLVEAGAHREAVAAAA